MLSRRRRHSLNVNSMSGIETGRFRFSRYVHRVPRGDQVCLVNLLSRGMIVLDCATLQAIDACIPTGVIPDEGAVDDPVELMEALIAGFYVVPDSFDEKEYITRRFEQDRSSRSALTLIVAPTIQCNLSCHYCYETRHPRFIDDQTVSALSAFAAEQLGSFNGIHVQWFGGEPLLALEPIRKISGQLMQLCERDGKRYSAELVTNGVLLTRDVGLELATLDVSQVQVTLEGAREHHDKVRRSRSVPRTFDQILNNLAATLDLFKTTIRVHVSPYNTIGVHDLIDELAMLGVAERIHRIYFAPLFNYAQGRLEPPFSPDLRKFLDVEGFASVQIELLHHAKKRGFPIPDFLDASYGLCSAVSRGTFLVNPDGTIAKCYLDAGDASEAVGDTGTGVDRAGENYSKWDKYDFFDDPECASCGFVPLCMGGCPKQKMTNASKSQVCTPLRYNLAERVGVCLDTAKG